MPKELKAIQFGPMITIIWKRGPWIPDQRFEMSFLGLFMIENF